MEAHPPNEGARLLTRAIKRLGHSQNDAERTIGCTTGAISKWLSGHQKPGLKWALRIEEQYSVPAGAWLREPAKGAA